MKTKKVNKKRPLQKKKKVSSKKKKISSVKTKSALKKGLKEKDPAIKKDKIFLKKMLDGVFPQMAEQILARALLISKQIRRKGSRS